MSKGFTKDPLNELARDGHQRLMVGRVGLFHWNTLDLFRSLAAMLQSLALTCDIVFKSLTEFCRPLLLFRKSRGSAKSSVKSCIL